MSPSTWATWTEPQEGQLRRVTVSRVDAASRRWPTSSRMLAGITAPSRRAALPSGRLILPRPEQYGQRRLSTSPDTAPSTAVPTGANVPAESASAEIYAAGPQVTQDACGTVCRTRRPRSAARTARPRRAGQVGPRGLEFGAGGGSHAAEVPYDTHPRWSATTKDPAPLRGRDPICGAKEN